MLFLQTPPPLLHLANLNCLAGLRRQLLNMKDIFLPLVQPF